MRCESISEKNYTVVVSPVNDSEADVFTDVEWIVESAEFLKLGFRDPTAFEKWLPIRHIDCIDVLSTHA